MAHPRCFNTDCGKEAVSRCDVCSPDGKLFLCENAACFDKAHNVFIAAKHRQLLVAWNSEATWTTKHCATHTNKPLDLWCDACRVPVCDRCLSHGAHKEHKTSLLLDVWHALQQDLQEQAGHLDAELERGSERLTQLARLREEATQREGSVGAARRTLDEVEELFADKVRVLRAELEAAVASWHDRAEEEYEQVAQRIVSVRALAESMRATSNEEEENAQRVVVEYEEQCRQREALGVPLPSLVGCAVGVPSDALAALRQAVADLAVVNDGVVPCWLCEEEVRESSATVCASCKRVLCTSCAPCIACCVKAERDALPEAVRDRVVVPAKVPQDSLAVAAAYRTIGKVWCGVGNNDEARRLYKKALSVYEEKAPNSLEIPMTYRDIIKIGPNGFVSANRYPILGSWQYSFDSFVGVYHIIETGPGEVAYLENTCIKLKHRGDPEFCGQPPAATKFFATWGGKMIDNRGRARGIWFRLRPGGKLESCYVDAKNTPHSLKFVAERLNEPIIRGDTSRY